MPAKLGSDKVSRKEKSKQLDSSVIYEKVTDKNVALSPSAWTVFQDFLKNNFKSKSKTDKTLEPEDKPAKESVAESTEQAELEDLKAEDHFKELHEAKKGGLNTDIIWSGVAVGCLIGTLYFVFGGLQPLVVKNYISNAKVSINNLGESFVKQVNILSSAQNTLVQNTSYNILSDCRAEQKFTKLEESVMQVDAAERSLFPNHANKEVAKFNGFAEREVRETYESFYAYYSQSLVNLQTTILEDIRDLPTYATYRNTWIDGCILIADVNSTQAQVVDYCKQLATTTEEYLNNQKPNFWSQIQKPIEGNLALCKQVVDGERFSFIDWKIRWLSGYGEITAYIPDVQKNVDRINSTIQDLQTESAKFKNKLDEIYNRKVSLTGMWYLLEL